MTRRVLLLLTFGLALIPGSAPAAPSAPDALPAWARLPTPRPAIRALAPAEPAGVTLRLGDGRELRLTGTVSQIAPLGAWPAAGMARAAVRVTWATGWVEGDTLLSEVEVPLPAGTELAATDTGPAVAVAQGPLVVRPQLRRGERVRVRHRLKAGCGATVSLWAEPKVLSDAYRPAAPGAAWRKPAGESLQVSCVSPAVTLSGEPDAEPMLVLPLCTVIGYGLHALEKRKGWVKLWYRPAAEDPLVLTGWMPEKAVTQATRGSCGCQCRRETTGIPVAGADPEAELLRDLPLYGTAAHTGAPVGLLRKGYRGDAPDPVSGSADVARVHVAGQALFVPHRAQWWRKLGGR